MDVYDLLAAPRVGAALIFQRVEFSDQYQRRWETAQLGIERRNPVVGDWSTIGEHISAQDIEDGGVRGEVVLPQRRSGCGRHCAGGDRVEKHLRTDRRFAAFPSDKTSNRSKITPRAVTQHGKPPTVTIQSARMLLKPKQSRLHVVDRGGKWMFGCQAVIERNHDTAACPLTSVRRIRSA